MSRTSDFLFLFLHTPLPHVHTLLRSVCHRRHVSYWWSSAECYSKEQMARRNGYINTHNNTHTHTHTHSHTFSHTYHGPQQTKQCDIVFSLMFLSRVASNNSKVNGILMIWLEAGCWLAVGWLLAGCWLVIGWLLAGYWLAGYWLAVGRSLASCTRRSRARLLGVILLHVAVCAGHFLCRQCHVFLWQGQRDTSCTTLCVIWYNRKTVFHTFVKYPLQ